MRSTRKLGIIQSSYIPWKGYFDIINDVDVFVFLEDVQFTKQDWRNRNKVKTNDGAKLISVPVKASKHHMGQQIHEVIVDSSSSWQKKHFNTFQMSYARAKYYADYKYLIEDFYNLEELALDLL